MDTGQNFFLVDFSILCQLNLLVVYPKILKGTISSVRILNTDNSAQGIIGASRNG